MDTIQANQNLDSFYKSRFEEATSLLHRALGFTSNVPDQMDTIHDIKALDDCHVICNELLGESQLSFRYRAILWFYLHIGEPEIFARIRMLEFAIKALDDHEAIYGDPLMVLRVGFEKRLEKCRDSLSNTPNDDILEPGSSLRIDTNSSGVPPAESDCRDRLGEETVDEDVVDEDDTKE